MIVLMHYQVLLSIPAAAADLARARLLSGAQTFNISFPNLSYSTRKPRYPLPLSSQLSLSVVGGVRVVAGIAVLVVSGGWVVTDASRLGVVGIPHLVGVGVSGEGVIGDRRGLVAAETKETTLLGAVAGSVVVGGRWAETLLLLALANEEKLGQGREDEEDTWCGMLVRGFGFFLLLSFWVCLRGTYMATMDTASIADSMRQAVLYLGRGTLPSLGELTSAPALPVPKTVLTLEPVHELVPFL